MGTGTRRRATAPLPTSSAQGSAAKGVTLPDRYRGPWRELFDDEVERRVEPGVRILDIGSGRRPALEPSRRPEGCVYVGLDISADELSAAPPGSYDRTIRASATESIPELVGSFDLVVSWQVLEHVKPLAEAADHLRSYLSPGGSLVAFLSGRFAGFATVNRIAPNRFGAWAMKKLLDRDPGSVFPAHYDRCYHGALLDVFADWSNVEIDVHYRGAGYFRFSRLLQRLYLRYEDWALRRGHRNLGTHYLVVAER